MAVREVATSYATTDGAEFEEKGLAERHQAVLDAEETHKEATRKLCRVLAEEQQTADGVPFEFSMMRDYYHVVAAWDGKPEIRRVDGPYYWSDWRFDKQGATLYEFKYDSHRSGYVRHEYPIGTLYYHERNARVACIAAEEKWLADRAAELAERRREWGILPAEAPDGR